MNEKWIRMRQRRPTAEDCDHNGCVLVWHIYNGAMVYEWRNAIENQLIVAWMPTPKAPEWLGNERMV